MIGNGDGGHGWWRGVCEGLGEGVAGCKRLDGGVRVYINGGLRIIKRGSRGGSCDGCLLMCGYLGRRRGWKQGKKKGGCGTRNGFVCILFESGLEHEGGSRCNTSS